MYKPKPIIVRLTAIPVYPFNVESSEMLENIKKSTLFNRLYKK